MERAAFRISGGLIGCGIAIAVLSLGAYAVDPAAAGQAMEETTVKSSTASPGAPRVSGSGAARRMVVFYGDLNLSRPAGVATLYGRLEAAADSVCSPREDIRNLSSNRDRRACYDGAMDRAVESVGNLGLQHMHLARTGRATDSREEVAGR